MSRKGVIEFASKPQANPVGLAFPQVAVRGSTMLIVYSYSGPYGAPDGQGGVLAYPGARTRTTTAAAALHACVQRGR